MTTPTTRGYPVSRQGEVPSWIFPDGTVQEPYGATRDLES